MACRRVTIFPTAEVIEQVTTDDSIVEPELSDESDPAYLDTLLAYNPHRLYLRSVCDKADDLCIHSDHLPFVAFAVFTRGHRPTVRENAERDHSSFSLTLRSGLGPAGLRENDDLSIT